MLSCTWSNNIKRKKIFISIMLHFKSIDSGIRVVAPKRIRNEMVMKLIVWLFLFRFQVWLGVALIDRLILAKFGRIYRLITELLLDDVSIVCIVWLLYKFLSVLFFCKYLISFLGQSVASIFRTKVKLFILFLFNAAK